MVCPWNDALSRINLASPANGVRRTALISGNTFKEAIVDSRQPAMRPAAQTYIDDLVTEGLISDENENLKAWTGFIEGLCIVRMRTMKRNLLTIWKTLLA